MNIKQELIDLEAKGLYRRMRLMESAQGARVRIDGKEVVNFSSNDYLGLANDPRIKEAAKKAIDTYGFGSGASRLCGGYSVAHKELEEKIAEFKGAERCLLFNSGYTANLGIISTLFTRGTVVLCDSLNHASIIDGILLSRSPFKRYEHCDLIDLERSLKELEGRDKVIITDSVFSMDGDIAPLQGIMDLAKEHGAYVMVDEAHSSGVLGANGKGVFEHFGISSSGALQMGTLSKAFGSFGAFVCADSCRIEFLINKCRAFIYTTALPPAVISASLRALEIIRFSPELRERLWENTRYMKECLNSLGLDILGSQTPIIPILTKEAALTMELSRRLFEEGVYLQGIRPPTVPQGKCRLRLTLSAAHNKDDIDKAVEKIRKTGKELCLI